MALQVRRVDVGFENTAQPNGRRVKRTHAIDFGRPVKDAWAVLTGLDLEFTNGQHPLRRTKCNVEAERAGNAATISVTLGWRDDSGEWDDPYQRSVFVTLFADVAARWLAARHHPSSA